MTINPVIRVQCDGPCHGWLSFPDGSPPGTPVKGLALTVRPTPERAVLFTGERRARLTAMHNGWSVVLRVGAAAKCLCPACKVNPLGIRLPPPGLDM